MSRTSKNTLMIGGALILIALLLFCGPLTGRFGDGGQKIEDVPSVAAGPPDGAKDIAEAAAVGALVGAAATETDATGLDALPGDEEHPPVGELAVASVVAPIAVVAAADSADSNGSGGSDLDGTGGGSELPPVSAGPPPMAAVATPTASMLDDGGGSDPDAAPQAFDAAMNGAPGLGRADSRFPLPVAAPGNRSVDIAQLDDLRSDGVLRPCDSPGSGCRNLSRAMGPKRLPNPGLTRGGRRNIVR